MYVTEYCPPSPKKPFLTEAIPYLSSPSFIFNLFLLGSIFFF
jgi:hypothetical protein